MGSGEADVKYIKIDPVKTEIPSQTYSQGNWSYTWPYWQDNNTSNNIHWTSTNTVYLYDIKCPKSSCKTRNWLQIDVVTPCKKCGSKLKAVSNEADYEIPVEK